MDLVALEIVEACTGDYREMLPAADNFYRAFTDPNGGSDDSFAMAISHKSKDRIIIDAIREVRPPFSPDAVVDDFAAAHPVQSRFGESRLDVRGPKPSDREARAATIGRAYMRAID